jgi:iron complex transport system ATP-binding protein
MLEINQLFVSYGSTNVLKDVSLTAQAGQVLAIIGPNGAGKSTLIKASSGVLPIKSGHINVGGENIASLSPSQRARMIAVVPQARSLPAAFTVYQAVLLGRTPHIGWLGHPKAQDHDQVIKALELTHILPFAERRIGELSGGEQQRVLLARAIAQQTPVLLLDEPTTHLDLKHQSSFLNLIRKLAVHQNLAVMMVVHDLNLGSLYADKVALFRDGCIHAIGTPEEVLNQGNIFKVYQIPVHIIKHPDYNAPLILPDGLEPQLIPTHHRSLP